MITRESILSKTQYGVKIYCHILHEKYQGETVMHQVGRDCGLCRNPFTNGEKTLHIERVRLHPEQKLSDEIARHHDVEGGIPDGDCFDFAQLYYGVAGQELLNRINAEMYLHLEEGYCPYGPERDRVPDVVQPEIRFSFFKSPITNTQPHKNISLLDAYNFITGDYVENPIEIDPRNPAETDTGGHFASESPKVV